MMCPPSSSCVRSASTRGAANNRQCWLLVVPQRKRCVTAQASRHSFRLIRSRLVVADCAGTLSGAGNCFELVKLINSISGDRMAAAGYVCAWMQHARRALTDEEWPETVEPCVWHDAFFLPTKSLFARSRFSTFFFSMKMAESENIVLVSSIIYFDDIHV